MTKNIYIILAVIVAVAVIMFAISKLTGDPQPPQEENLNQTVNTETGNTNPVSTTTPSNPITTNPTTTMNELKIETIKQGNGPEAKNGDKLLMHYTGTLTNGQKFDSSVDRGLPFEFTLGAGQVIQGWEKGVLGMKVGEKRKLTIPPDMGYGAAGAGGGIIPPNATLIFEIELMKIN